MKPEPGMPDVLGVPLHHLILCLGITSAITFVFFLPAISDFGHSLIGTEDIRYFIWLFWHYGNSVGSGSNPLFANEVFYPYGISLSYSTIVPFQFLIYWALPQTWGAFGKITFLQVLSFILGGVFSFCLVYRFAKSFLPSLFGSFVFNFSVYHFEKALHHLNYSMAFPFLALFFLFYLTFLEDKKSRTLAFLSLALLLLALNEPTVAVMAGFIALLDISARYAKAAGVDLFTPRNVAVIAASALASLLAHEAFVLAALPAIIIYVAPSFIFLIPCAFIVLGAGNLARAEGESGYFKSLLLCAAPTLAYLVIISSLQPSYAFNPDSILADGLRYTIPIEYLVVPSDFQAISHAGIFNGLPAQSETGIYLGLTAVILLLMSFFLGRASKEEAYFRDLFFLSLAFCFPIILVSGEIALPTPFFVESLFPMLSVLRVASRFMLFALLFLSIIAAFVANRLVVSKGLRGKLLVILLAGLLLLEQWPAPAAFLFNGSVPQFYASLAKDQSPVKIFLYPDTSYRTLLNEIYYQTIHGKALSYGLLSRFPSSSNPLFSLYGDSGSGQADPERVAEFVRAHDYDYIVVQKLFCTSECFYGASTPIDPVFLGNVRAALGKDFGPPVFEDDTIIVYGKTVSP